MRRVLEFRSDAFPPQPNEQEETNPGIYGKTLAEFLRSALIARSYDVIYCGSEDWGWRVDVRNDQFSLWLGCSSLDDTATTFRVFIEPSKPTIRKWSKRVDTGPAVEPFATTIHDILFTHEQVFDLRWSDAYPD